jgi:hypothetical protein
MNLQKSNQASSLNGENQEERTLKYQATIVAITMLLLLVPLMLFGEGRDGYMELVYYKLTRQTAAGRQLKQNLQHREDSIKGLQDWFAQNYYMREGLNLAHCTFRSTPIKTVGESGDTCSIIVKARSETLYRGEADVYVVYHQQLLISLENVKSNFYPEEVRFSLDNDEYVASPLFEYDKHHVFFSIMINDTLSVCPFHAKQLKAIRLVNHCHESYSILFDKKTAVELQKHLRSLYLYETNKVDIPDFYTIFYRLF